MYIKDHSLTRFGQRQFALTARKRRLQPAIDGTPMLKRAALLISSTEAYPSRCCPAHLAQRSLCRRRWCPRPEDQRRNVDKHVSQYRNLGVSIRRGRSCVEAMVWGHLEASVQPCENLM